MSKFGDLIKELRTTKGLSLSEFARQLNIAPSLEQSLLIIQ